MFTEQRAKNKDKRIKTDQLKTKNEEEQRAKNKDKRVKTNCLMFNV
jgi:hypothetical protein